MNTVLIIFIVSTLLLIWAVPNEVWKMLLNLAIIVGLGCVAYWSGIFLLLQGME